MSVSRIISLCVLSTVSVITAPALLSAEDWFEFRGPTGQGHSSQTSLPTAWSPTEHVLWNTKIPGVGWSSPIIVGEKVFVTTAVPEGDGPMPEQSLRVICLDLESGKILWDKEIFQETKETVQRIHKKNSHASPTPNSDGKVLYVHFGTHGTACLTLDGDVVWKTNALKYEMQHGNGGSPILVDDKLVVICDGKGSNFIAALNRKTGEIAWKVERNVDGRKKFSFATPLLITVNGEEQIVAPGTDVISGHSPKDGKEIWHLDYTGYSVIPRPIYSHGLIFVTTSYDRPTLLAIRPDGKGDVTESHLAWSNKNQIPHTPSLLVVGDELYTVSDKGIAQCFDAKTGKLHWKERVGGNYSASPLFADGKIYFQSEEGETTIIAPGTTYKEISRNHLKEPTLASYAVAGDTLLIRTKSQLYRIGK
ncbi:outer membrane biogenesis protein BamB [Gimesia chilikensis]|uniref:Outer membrane biogenesis protein BamB n=1 Tax=Gimesia chilikensis TaxID=2605989 RepID=A0A517W739_9PLAN|nr:PQQ-binding-like beta-propeller repeat protein [Gimesia chilikensis]QDU01077.1 outer membrane biogenesis protein BamB [Gimesia chilikensis]